MNRLAYDGIAADENAILAAARPGDLVFYYADGRYAWPASSRDRLLGAGLTPVAITVTGDPACGIYDGPPDQGTQRNWAAYLRARAAHGGSPGTIYTDRDLWPQLRARCAGLDYHVIIADPTGRPHGLPGAIGVQYYWGRKFDLTLVTASWWRPRP